MLVTTNNLSKNIRVNAKGQTLLFVFLLLLLLTLLGGAIAVMWETGLHALALQKESIAAFYLAQAGFERAMDKIAIEGNPTPADRTVTGNLGGGSYTFEIAGTGANKGITSTGRFGMAERVIYKRFPNTISCNKVGCPPYGNAWGYWRKFGNAWEEQ